MTITWGFRDSCCATRWNNNKGLCNRNHLSRSRSPDFRWHFCHKDNFILFDMLFCFFTSVSKHYWSLCIWYRSVTVWNLRGKNPTVESNTNFFFNLIENTKAKSLCGRGRGQANQHKDMVSGYNGCMCFSGMSWGPSALNVKHEWNSRC